MKIFATILVVLGVCIGALGASGFHRPANATEASVTESGLAHEDYALALFLLGAVTLAGGGFLSRSVRKAEVHAGAAEAGLSTYVAGLESVRAIVRELDERKESVPGDELRERLGRLLAEELFDLTSKSDDLVTLVGFDAYARVWEGIATAERLLGRCWSLCADGHLEEGMAELPLARTNLDRAAEELAKLT